MSNKSLIQSDKTYTATPHVTERSRLSFEDYQKLYAQSVTDPESFWNEVALSEIEWFSPFSEVLKWNYPDYEWFVGGKLNITHNCLDRHVRNNRRHKIAYIWTDEKGSEKKITYGELLEAVCRMASGLKSLGLNKGDTATIYMPLILEQIIAILACARIGVIHSVVYGGFSASALKLRIEDAKSKIVITSSHTLRRGKEVPLKAIVDEAVQSLDFVHRVIVVQRPDHIAELREKEISYQELTASQPAFCEPVWMDSEDPLFILYTSGTTGKPKGVLHTTGGYSVYTSFTSRMVFDLHEDDLFWCTADPGWVTGHSYIIYGPLSLGATSIVSEGAPDYPDPGRFWSLIEKYRVNIFYTAPTAIRMFMKHGSQWPKKYDLSSLRVLGSVGEPINPEAWIWYHENIGRNLCSVVDTWWQTETGGHMITTLPSIPQKPGKAGLPFFGVVADVVDKQGQSLEPDMVGHLILRRPWPAALRTCYGEPERFEKYWNTMQGVYYAGDLATKDKDGYIMILGRADDVLNVAGHRIGTAEVESALVAHSSVAEAAVIGKPHEIKGESIKAFVVLRTGFQNNEDLEQNLKLFVRKELGSLAVPDEIEVVERLPKTRSGKIMRRVLKAKELGFEPGDTSTLEE